MDIVKFLPNYFFWHYTEAFRNIWGIWTNFLWFTYNFFSLPILARTLFMPWQRLDEEYKKGFDVKEFSETLVVNSLMRIVGISMRLTVILVGSLALVSVVFLGLGAFLLWALLPLVLIFLLAKGTVALS